MANAASVMMGANQGFFRVTGSPPVFRMFPPYVPYVRMAPNTTNPDVDAILQAVK
jgi:hypothetical protein